MQKLRRTLVLTLLQFADLTVLAVGFVGALLLTDPTPRNWGSVLEVRIKLGNFVFFVLYLASWHVLLRAFGLYRSYRLSPGAREWRDLGGATAVGIILLSLLSVPLEFSYATGRFLLAFGCLAFVGLGFERRLLRYLARLFRVRGRNLRNAVLVGSREATFDMAARLGRRVDLGYRVVDFVEVPGDRIRDEASALARIEHDINQQPVDEVFVALPLDRSQRLIRDILALCEEQGVTVRLVSQVLEPALARAKVDAIDDQAVVTIFTGPSDTIGLAAKRAMDVVVSVISIVLLSPLLVFIACAIKLTSPGPVLFVQDRVGLNRRRLRIYKFRTMHIDAAERQGELEKLNEAEGPVFKIRDDPRVTQVGRWLRRLSMDEMPQFLNVLRGEMSLVGPRPLPLRDVSRITVAAHKRRFSVKPGITCLWQVNGREPKFQDWIKADMEYIDNWSLALDAKILLKTIPAVLSRRGAY